MCAKMARYPQIHFWIRQIVTVETLPKCHVLPFNPDDMAVLEIGTKIATVYWRSEFTRDSSVFVIFVGTSFTRDSQFSRHTQGGIQRHGTCTPWRQNSRQTFR